MAAIILITHLLHLPQFNPFLQKKQHKGATKEMSKKREEFNKNNFFTRILRRKRRKKTLSLCSFFFARAPLKREGNFTPPWGGGEENIKEYQDSLGDQNTHTHTHIYTYTHNTKKTDFLKYEEQPFLPFPPGKKNQVPPLVFMCHFFFIIASIIARRGGGTAECRRRMSC